MRRRTILRAGAAGLAAGAAAPALAGCGADSGGSGSGTTLRYALWDTNQRPAMAKAAKEFEKAHPGVKVSLELLPYGQYWTTMQTAATGGTTPDVAWMTTIFFQLYAKYGQLIPMCRADDGASIGAQHYPESLIKAYTWDGQLYGLPKDYDTIGLWYNKQLFDRAGMRYPDSTWTWNDLHGAARRLRDAKKGVYGFASELSGQGMFYNLVYQNDGRIVSKDGKHSGYDSPRTVEALRFAIDMIKDGSSPSMATMVDSTPASLFQSGLLGMTFQGSWMVPQFAGVPLLKQHADIALLPKGRTRATIINGLANVVFKTTKHPKLARELALWMSSKRTCEIQGEGGVVIPSYKGTEQIWLRSNPQYHLQNYIDQLPYAVPFPHSINTAAWQNEESAYLPAAWAGFTSVESATSTLAKSMNLDLQREARS